MSTNVHSFNPFFLYSRVCRCSKCVLLLLWRATLSLYSDFNLMSIEPLFKYIYIMIPNHLFNDSSYILELTPISLPNIHPFNMNLHINFTKPVSWFVKWANLHPRTLVCSIVLVFVNLLVWVGTIIDPNPNLMFRTDTDLKQLVFAISNRGSGWLLENWYYLPNWPLQDIPATTSQTQPYPIKLYLEHQWGKHPKCKIWHL